MDYLSEYLPSNSVLALVIASLIFIVCVALIAKKIVSFVLTVILLFIAIAAGMAIANNDLVQDYLMNRTREKAEPKTATAPAIHQEEPHASQETKKSLSESLDKVRDEVEKMFHQISAWLSSEAQKPSEKSAEQTSPAIPQSERR